MVTGQLVDMPTRGLDASRLDDSWTGQLVDWTSRGLDNSQTRQLVDALLMAIALALVP